MSKELSFAVKTARAAGALLRKSLAEGVVEHAKGAKDIVTAADYESQKFIKQQIAKAFPRDSVLCEETPAIGGEEGAKRLWVVDPIDGTVNYSAGLPDFCVSIGLAEKGKPVLGCIYDPSLDEAFYAEKGKGAFLNGERIAVTSRPLEKSVMNLSLSRDYAKMLRILQAIKRLHPKVRRFRSYGTIALESAYIAAGRSAGYVNLSSTPWDFCAARVIVEEAGGCCADAEGKAWNFRSNSIVAASSRRNLAEIIKAMKK